MVTLVLTYVIGPLRNFMGQMKVANKRISLT